MAKGNFFKSLRILILLFILLGVSLGTWLSKARTTDWNEPLWVTIYPINGDGSEVSQRYIENLDPKQFDHIQSFMKQQARLYGIPIENPIEMKLRNQVSEKPPTPPQNRNIVAIAWWSLKLRHWANSVEKADPELPGDIRMFVNFYDPQTHPTVQHSLGLQKGLIGVVHAFAGRRQSAQNNVVIAHELLHTLGATDKYSPVDNLPIHPEGYADPDRQPLFPQTSAELMGGRIPLSPTNAEIPASLKNVVIGPLTAAEINWSAR